jgi:hypothetical protein
MVSAVLCVKLLCDDTEEQPETSLAVITPVKLDRLRKAAIRRQNKRTIYNVYKFLKTFLSNLNISAI